MDGYLTKPLDRKRLAESIERLLGSAAVAPPVDWEQFVSLTDGDREFAEQLVQLFIDSGDAALATDPRCSRPRGLAGRRPRGALLQGFERQHSRAGGERCGRTAGTSRARRRVEQLSKLEQELRREARRVTEYLRARQARA
jgi:hypothetical protein